MRDSSTMGSPEPRKLLDPLLVTALVALATAFLSATAITTFDTSDEGYLLRWGERAAGGELPHRDFGDVYGPGTALLNGALVAAFEREILGVRLFVVLAKTLSVALTFLIARCVAPRPFAVLAALLAILYWGRPLAPMNAPYAVFYTIPLCLLSLLVLLRGLERRSRGRLFVAGLIAGSALLFKQSLGIFNAYGMALALGAVALLDPSPPRAAPGRERRAVLVVWCVAAILPLVPVAAKLTLRDYAIHFLPLHLLVLLVAAIALRRGGVPTPASLLRSGLVPLVLGVGVVPGATALFYLWEGGLSRLVYYMFLLPLDLPGYYYPVGRPPLGPPPLASAPLLCLAGLAFVSGALLALGRSMRGAALAIGVALALLGAAALVWDGGAAARPRAWLTSLDGTELSLMLFALLLLCAPRWLRATRGSEDERAVLAVAFSQAMLCFQVFPVAGFNAYTAQASVTPLAGLVLWRWYRVGAPAPSPAARRIFAACLVLLVPMLLAVPLLLAVVRPHEGVRSRTLDLPFTTGIAPRVTREGAARLTALEQLVRFLGSAEPRDAAVFVVPPEPMILYLSGRAPLLPESEWEFALMHAGLAPASGFRYFEAKALARRLSEDPAVIVVDVEGSASSSPLLRSAPELARVLEERFEERARFGGYRVLRPATANRRATE